MSKSLEMRRKKNLDAFNEIDEINWKGQSHNSGRSQEELDSIRELLESDSFTELTEETRDEDKTSSGILKALEESEKTDEELWSASDLGKYTINTPTQQKKAVEQQEIQMQPVSELEFQEISDDVDKVDADMQKRLEEMAKRLEEELGF